MKRTKSTSQSDWVVGWHAVHACLYKKPQAVQAVYVDPKRHDERVKKVIEMTRLHQIPLHRHWPQEAELRSLEHQGIAAFLSQTQTYTSADLFLSSFFERDDPPSQSRFLLLEGIQDPHNLGACLRSAAFFGVDAVFMTEHESAPITPLVRKTAVGAVECLHCMSIGNTGRFLEKIKSYGVWVIGTVCEESASLDTFSFPEHSLIIMGNEAAGLRRLTQRYCDYQLSIPGGMSGVESLNVSVATGVVLYAAMRPSIDRP